MLGHKECIQLLLAHSAPVKCKNLQGWSPLAEAISYGDRQTSESSVSALFAFNSNAFSRVSSAQTEEAIARNNGLAAAEPHPRSQ